MDAGTELAGLFISAFISSTLFPGGSELVLGALDNAERHSVWLLLLVASAGNTLGGMTSWWVGRLLTHLVPDKEVHKKAISRLRKWGAPVLLLSWVPVAGDPLCVAAGWLRIHWLTALLFIAVGKIARYAVILYLV